MPTMSLELATTFNESLARRRIGDPFYAGIPCSGFDQSVTNVAQGATYSIALDTPVQTVIAAADPATTTFIGWVAADGTAVEVPLNLIAVVSPPIGITSLRVRNGGDVGSNPVPIKLIVIR